MGPAGVAIGDWDGERVGLFPPTRVSEPDVATPYFFNVISSRVSRPEATVNPFCTA